MGELVLVLDNLRSCENVGSILRSCDAVNVSRVFLCGYTPGSYHNRVKKSALGAEDSVDHVHVRQTWRLIDLLKKDGYKIVGLERTMRSANLFDLKPEPDLKIALVIGNEVKGLGKTVQSRCDVILEIPMSGIKQSLNVAVATGIALYHIATNRPNQKS